MKLRTVAPAATIALAALVGVAGCKKGDSNANGANTRNTTITSNTTTTTNSGTTTPLGTPTSTASAATPTEAFRLYYEAIKRGDAPAVKALFSRATLEMLEAQAKATGKSLDDVFGEGFQEARRELPDVVPETRNEKVNGDRATLEINDAKKGSWDKLYFVKEGGWKIGFADVDRSGGAGGGDDDSSSGGDDDDEKDGGGDHSGGH